MKYYYSSTHTGDILEEFDKQGIPWEYMEQHKRGEYRVFSCNLEPEIMAFYMESAVHAPVRLVPIPIEVIRNRDIADTLQAHNCANMAFIRRDENETKIIYSGDLYPGRFDERWYPLKPGQKHHLHSNDIIRRLGFALKTLGRIKAEETDDYISSPRAVKDNLEMAAAQLEVLTDSVVHRANSAASMTSVDEFLHDTKEDKSVRAHTGLHYDPLGDLVKMLRKNTGDEASEQIWRTCYPAFADLLWNSHKYMTVVCKGVPMPRYISLPGDLAIECEYKYAPKRVRKKTEPRPVEFDYECVRKYQIEQEEKLERMRKRWDEGDYSDFEDLFTFDLSPEEEEEPAGDIRRADLILHSQDLQRYLEVEFTLDDTPFSCEQGNCLYDADVTLPEENFCKIILSRKTLSSKEACSEALEAIGKFFLEDLRKKKPEGDRT